MKKAISGTDISTSFCSCNVWHPSTGLIHLSGFSSAPSRNFKRWRPTRTYWTTVMTANNIKSIWY